MQLLSFTEMTDNQQSSALTPAPLPEGEGFVLVRPAGRTYLEVKVLYTLGKEKC
jgi:hypothetical protein